MPIKVQSSIRLMEDHRLGAAVRDNKRMIAAKGPQAELDLFFVVGAGANEGRICNLQREEKSPTGWRRSMVGEPGLTFKKGILASNMAGRKDHRRHSVFVAEAEAFSPDIYFSQESAPGVWGNWTHIPTKNSGVPYDSCIVSLAAEWLGGEKMGLYAVIGPSPEGQPRPLALWSIPWDEKDRAWTELGQVTDPFIKYAKVNVQGKPREGLLCIRRSRSAPSRSALVLVSPSGAESPVVVADDIAVDLITVEETREGCSMVCFTQGRDSGEGISTVDCSREKLIVETIPETRRLKPRQLLAVDADALPLGLYVLDDERNLHIVNRSGKGKWQTPLNLGFVFSRITGGTNEGGYPQIFGASARPASLDRLQCISKSAVPGNDLITSGWRFYDCDAGSAKDAPPVELQAIKSCAMELTVSDEKGNVQANRSLSIEASEHCTAVFNNRHLSVGPGRPAAVKTDPSGRIFLTLPTDTLAAPVWTVRSVSYESPMPSAEGEDGFAGEQINPNLGLLADLRKLREADLRAMIKPGYDAAKVYQALQTVTAYPSLSAVNGDAFLLDLDSIPEGGWQFSITSESVAFEELTSEEAQMRMERAIADAAEIGSLWDWFADAARAIANAVVEAITWTVNKVSQVVKAVLEVTIEGVKYVFDGMVKTVEQIARVTETILNGVGAFFSKVFEYVGMAISAFRRDIGGAKRLIQKEMDDSLANLIEAAPRAKAHSRRVIGAIGSQLGTQYDELVNKLGYLKFDSRGDDVPEIGSAAGFAEALQQASVFISEISRKIIDELSVIDPGELTNIAAKLLKPIEELFNSVKEKVDKSLGRKLEILQRAFTDLMTGRQDFFNTTLRTFFDLFRELIRDATDIAVELSDLFWNLLSAIGRVVQDILKLEIKSALIRAIYALIKPDGSEELSSGPLTVGDVVSLLCAVPCAIGYRLCGGKLSENISDSSALVVLRRAFAGILRLVVWTPFDVGMTVAPLLVSVGFIVRLVAVIMSLLVMPADIFHWEPSKTHEYCQWLSVFLPAIAFMPAPLFEGKLMELLVPVATSFFGIGSAIGCWYRAVVDPKLSNASRMAMVAVPLPPVCGVLKLAGAKAIAALCVVKAGTGFVVGGLDLYEGLRP